MCTRPLAMVVFIEKEFVYAKSITGMDISKVQRHMTFCAWTLVSVEPEMLVRTPPSTLSQVIIASSAIRTSHAYSMALSSPYMVHYGVTSGFSGEIVLRDLREK